MKKRPFVVIASHALFTQDGSVMHGTGSSLPQIFEKADIDWMTIQSPIYGDGYILIEQNIQGKKSVFRAGDKTSISLIKKSAEEYKQISRLLRLLPHVSLYIGVDPLNALFGIIAKQSGMAIDHVVYYTADYANKRFANPMINALYHMTDRLVLKQSDQVWNVSSSITRLRERMGVPKKKNYFIPNVPDNSLVGLSGAAKRKKTDLIIVGTSTTALDYDLLIKSLPVLHKIYPALRLLIVGELHFSSQLKRALAPWVKKGVVVLKGKRSHQETISLMKKAGIGLAPYTNRETWTTFGDSMKIREYVACGLPIITTDVVSTSSIIDEFRCGKIIALTQESFVRAVTHILKNKNYSAYSAGSYKAADAYRLDRILKTPLLKIGVNL